MRKRFVKSVAHWVIMSVILLFPVLMVGISSFAQKQQEIHVNETYAYETNEVNSVDDLVVGNIYNLELTKNDMQNFATTQQIFCSELFHIQMNTNNVYQYVTIDYLLSDENHQLLVQFTTSGVAIQLRDLNNVFIANYINININDITNFKCNFVYLSNQYSEFVQYVSASDYLGEKTIDYTITDQTMRDDVNEWCSSFRNLPVNQWYGNMLDTIGLGITNSMMMNVIYTYPLYVLWVYIIDLVVDCLLVIINFGHNALKRLGGDNE